MRFGRSLSTCDVESRLGLLRSLYEGNAATRLVAKIGLAPIKTLHLDDPRVYRSVGCQYRAAQAASESAPHVKAQIFNAESLEDLQTLTCDVVVVGSGAGGAVVASELARKGHEVIILEAGEHPERSTSRLSRPR